MTIIESGKLRLFVLAGALALSACGKDNTTSDAFGDGTGTVSGTGDGGSGDDTATDTGGGGGSSDGDPIFDVPVPDAGTDPGDGIPETCADAEDDDTTVGCLFFAVDMDLVVVYDQNQYAVAVSNVQDGSVANVTVEVDDGAGWTTVEGPVAVDALDLHIFNLPDRHIDNSGLRFGGAYRITSDVPIIAYQFEPFQAGDSFTSDASLLYPVQAWDTFHYVMGQTRINTAQSSYFTIIAAYDGTEVTITPSTDTSAGTGGVPAGMAGTPFMMMMDEGDVLQVAVAAELTDPTGTKVESNDEHPVAVFYGNTCALIPDNSGACDHLQDQLFGARLWGQRFVAARMPVRSTEQGPEDSLWQIFASKDSTQVTFTGSANLVGLPVGPQMLDTGDVLEVFVHGTFADPGDFLIDANEPIAVVNYMTGSSTVRPLVEPTLGDPSMVQLSPIEQFLPRYVVLVPPDHWMTDVATITRSTGEQVSIDGADVPDGDFVAVGTDHEVAHVVIDDGVHVLQGSAPFSIVIAGYDDDDSYAYLGGAGTSVINPDPEG